MTQSPAGQKSLIVEFEGPEGIRPAIETLSEPGVDGVVVKALLSAVEARCYFPNILLVNSVEADRATLNAPIYLKELSQRLPQLTEVDALVQQHWDELAFAGTSLKREFTGTFFARYGSEAHVDTINWGGPLYSKEFFGPLAASLGLHGAAEFGLRRLPSAWFSNDDGSGQLSTERCEALNANLPVEAANDKMFSKVAQGVGDLVMWVQPQTAHYVTLLEEPRVALVADQLFQ